MSFFEQEGAGVASTVNLPDPSGQAVPIAIAIARAAVGAAAGAFAGWTAGKLQGNTFSAVIGGVVGGIVGGAVGLVAPQTSKVSGGLLGGAAAGLVGGLSGGIIGGAMEANTNNPGASVGELALGIINGGLKGAGIGTITGAIIGGIGTAAVAGGAPLWAADLVGTLGAEPIAIGLGLVPFPWWGSDSKPETLGPSTPYDMMFGGLGTMEEFYVQYQEPSLTIIGGFPPYTWHVEPGSKYFLALEETTAEKGTILYYPVKKK
ncbi:MAG: hypothetical protein DRH11_14240, partial [Deltaproteobacteria bacterium]